jgi:hypothetical protein
VTTRIGLSVLLLLASAAPSYAQDAPAPAQPAAPAPWYQRLRFGGDFRSRYEGFYEDGEPTRNRVRLRLRLRIDADINEDAQFHLQVASGDPGTPVSTNQTFTEFFLPKPFNLDRAYILYAPKAAPAITLGIGKFPTPFAYTQMTFDDDLNYEGGWQELGFEPREGLDVSIGALQTAISERTAAVDTYMVAGAGEVALTRGRRRFSVSLANYLYGNPDAIAVASVRGPLESILTNELVRDAADNVIGYASEFNVVDIVAEATFRTSRPDYPFRFLADFARNTRAANDRNTGVWLEAEYGAPRRSHTWGATYTVARVEQDMAPSAFVFSDMPGTNLRLHMLETYFVPKEGLSLDTTLHFTKPLFIAPGRAPRGWLTRLHLAAVVRF